MMKKTYMQKTAEVQRNWQLLDATEVVLGHLATEIATKLMGKHKPTYTPHIDTGDYVVVINASKIAITGRKSEGKVYYTHSGFSGNLKEESFAEMLERKPAQIIEKAVYNMLPDNKLRSDRMDRLKVYPTAEHPHQGQVAGGTKPTSTENNQ